jgi:hypothetical protein
MRNIFFVAIIFFSSCNSADQKSDTTTSTTESGKTIVRTDTVYLTRNVDITPANSYSDLFLDSNTVAEFIKTKKLSKPDLYIENSPLFHLQKVKTPLVIMSNDADGAVPWYQGIEFFTAMRRLNKPVWLLNYNGEAHNLVERKNRKDIQIREQQFFDWLLKGERAPKWITDGIPAVMKGRDLGLGY